jgi:hypothetical protein
MSDDRHHAMFVQFPHPGGELSPATDEVAWNTGQHARKFLSVRGRYIDGPKQRSGELVVWAEWEAPSRVIERWPSDGLLPRALHQPYWPRLAPQGFRQNTDPWIFGERMRYSNCKQLPLNATAPTAMQRLPIGSVVCFGSTIGGRFVLDTVLVVASSRPWIVGSNNRIKADAAFRTCTMDALATGAHCVGRTFTLYAGATDREPVGGMFSFVPALPQERSRRFARPVIELPGYINPENLRSTWGANRPLHRNEIIALWWAVKEQVVAQGLCLATAVETPPVRNTVPPTTGSALADSCSPKSRATRRGTSRSC